MTETLFDVIIMTYKYIEVKPKNEVLMLSSLIQL